VASCGGWSAVKIWSPDWAMPDAGGGGVSGGREGEAGTDDEFDCPDSYYVGLATAKRSSHTKVEANHDKLANFWVGGK